MFARPDAAALFLALSGCGFDWSLPTPPPEEGGASTSGDTTPTSASGAGGVAHTGGSGGAGPQSTGPSTNVGAGGVGAGGSPQGTGAGGAEPDACVECADNYVALCCDTADCASELHAALADPNHVLTWQSDVNCYEYDAALACAACSKLCVFQCADYFPNAYCYDDTWCD